MEESLDEPGQGEGRVAELAAGSVSIGHHRGTERHLRL